MSLAATSEASTFNYRQRLGQLLPAVLLFYLVFLWPLIYARGGVTADLATVPLPEEHGFLLNRLFFPVLAGIALLILVAERHRLRRFHLGGFLLVAGFFAYLGLTSLWALDPSVTVAKLFLFALQGVTLLAAVLTARRPDDVLMPMFWVLAATVAVNVLALPVIDATPIGYAGIYAHKNTLGGIAAMAGLFALYALTRPERAVRLTGLVLLPLVFLLLVRSESKTSLGLFLLAPLFALVALFVRRYFRLALVVLLILVSLPSAFLLGGAVPGFSYHSVSRLISGDGSFTGRTEIWAFAVKKVLERPLTGYGYQSFWGLGELSPAAKLPDGFVKVTPHAHNGYLDLLLQGGLIALGLFALLQVMTSLWIDQESDDDRGLGYFLTAAFVYMLLQNLLETDWLQGISGSSLLVTLMILMAAAKPPSRRTG